MQGSLQHKLLQYESAPPPAAWKTISQRLNEEFNHSDARVSTILEGASVIPPESVWSQIAGSLDNTQRPAAKVIPLLYKRLAVAVILSGIIAAGVMYFFTGYNNNSSEKNAGYAIVQNNPAVQKTFPSPLPGTNEASADAPKEKAPVSSNRLHLLGNLVKKIRSANTAEVYNPIKQSDVKRMQTVAALAPVTVSAPPIRDAYGNIIMDLDVISKPNDPYIVVTSPSGNQTKISSKFLHCLSYLNGDYSSADNSEGTEWKTRFQQWREKLLSEAAFVPAANNFFDIFEMKEMIEEQ